MNLRGVANRITSRINRNVVATVRRSTGYVTAADGSRKPTYTEITVPCQVQPISTSDIKMLDGLQIQGVRRAIYVSAEVEGMLRVDKQGGDIIWFPPGVMPEGGDWKVAAVIEAWPHWRKIAVVLQSTKSGPQP